MFAIRGQAFALLLVFTCVALFVCGTTISNAQTSNVRSEISLNNNWSTALKGSSNWIAVNIPHNWDDYYGYRRLVHGNLHTDATYKKTFAVKQSKTNKRFFLFFEGVGSYAKVFLNNKFVGSHAGGRTTFTLDVTDAILTNGTINNLEVQASHPANIQDLPWVCGGCSDERGFSEGSQPLGIFRPVSLEITNDVRIQPFGVHAWANMKSDNADLNITTTLKNYAAEQKKITLQHFLQDATGKSILLFSHDYILKSKDSLDFSAKSLKVTKPVLWSVEHPYLYRIISKVKMGSTVIDEMKSDFGFRTINWKTPTHQFILNGKPVFLNGIAEYEHLIGQGHAFSKAQVESRVKWIEAAGFNAFRDGHQPHNLLYGKLFNQKGILWWTQLSAHVWYDTPEFKNNFKQLLKEWVIERRNDPSVILWGLQNESKIPKDFAEECTQLIRSLDPTASSERLVTTCNGGEGTDWDVPQNWTGTYGGNPDTYGDDLKKQVLVGEYGAWRTLDLHTEGGFQQNGPVSEDRFTQLMEKKVRLAESVKDSVAGHFFWLLTSHDNPGRVQGGEGFREIDRVGPINYKGMLTPWEEPTDAFYMFRSNFVSAQKEPMIYIVSHTWPNRWMQPGIKDSIMVYSNCDEVELFNDIDNASLGRQKSKGFGTPFMWNKVNIRYNVLYAVGYLEGKAVVRDTIVLFHLPKAPHFNSLYTGAKNITMPQPGYNYIYRINCGGAEYKDVNGNIWASDVCASSPALKGSDVVLMDLPGSISWTDKFPEMPAMFASQRRTFSPIQGTKDWSLFQHFRYGRHLLSYQFPVKNGEYLVELYFAEPWLGVGGSMNAAGMRLFDISINDSIYFKDLDIWKVAGANRAVKKTIRVQVTNGILKIKFPSTTAGQAIISAIAIASKNKELKNIQRVGNIFQSKCNGCKVQSWSDIGDQPFLNNPIKINNLPSNIYGAEWFQFSKKDKTDISFRVASASDVFVAVPKGKVFNGLNEFEKTGSIIVTDEDGGTLYDVYKKRIAQLFLASIISDSPVLVFVQPANNMQPAYDLKAVKSYKSDVAIINENVSKKSISGGDRNIVTSNSNAEITWPVAPGVADVYSITVKYNSPSDNDIPAILQLFDVSNNAMINEKIQFKFTKEGKWNYITVNTGSMINAGNYKVKLSVNNAKGLVISNIDMQ